MASTDKQEGGATKKGPASKVLGTNKTAIRFKIIGKGTTVRENLLPGTGKEIATMYHCDNFQNCSKVQAKHYCAKQNQPELVLDSRGTSHNVISLVCDKNNSTCNSNQAHVYKISHELSQNDSHLKTTCTLFKDGKYKKDSIYHIVKK